VEKFLLLLQGLFVVVPIICSRILKYSYLIVAASVAQLTLGKRFILAGC